MRIGGFKKSTLIDYPGKIACIIFTQGCVFRCHYCHNPELVCPKLFQKVIPEQEILDFLKTRQGKLDGVVISGGEPTLHRDLPEFIDKIKRMGFAIKLDTSGYFPDVVARLINLKLLDYIAMDIKAPLNKYKEIVQVNINSERIKRSIDIVMNSGLPYEFRTTILKRYHKEKDIVKIVKYIKGATNYHLQKFVPNKILDKELLKDQEYTEDELVNIHHKIKPYIFNSIIR